MANTVNGLRTELMGVINSLQSKFDELKTKYDTEIVGLRAELNIVREDNTRLREENAAAAARPPAWGNKLYKANEKQNEEVNMIVNAAKIELKESERRVRNVLIFGVAKSTKSTPEERKAEDMETVRGILSDTGANVVQKDIYRFQERSNSDINSKPPPILVECSTVEDRMRVIRMAKNLRTKVNRESIYIGPDLTPSEREYSKRLSDHRRELNEKRTPQEKETIIYVIRDNQVQKSNMRRPNQADLLDLLQ